MGGGGEGRKKPKCNKITVDDKVWFFLFRPKMLQQIHTHYKNVKYQSFAQFNLKAGICIQRGKTTNLNTHNGNQIKTYI